MTKTTVLNFDRRCGACRMSFAAESQEFANEMFERHLEEVHPEVPRVNDLIDRLDKLLEAWADQDKVLDEMLWDYIQKKGGT